MGISILNQYGDKYLGLYFTLICQAQCPVQGSIQITPSGKFFKSLFVGNGLGVDIGHGPTQPRHFFKDLHI